jgi:serine/threonine protein kinase
LGKGKNGVVYVAELTSGELETPGASRHIAVKKVPLSFKKKRSSQQISALRNEIEVLVHLGHQNLVKYFGWNIKTPQEATDQPQATFFRIFMEFCAGLSIKFREDPAFYVAIFLI